jgi:penicillin-binding protein 2
MQELATKTKTRLWIIAGIIYGLSALLLIRIFYLQFVMGAEYFRKAMENRTQMIPIQAYRSVILDRNETNRLAYNRKSLSILVVPAYLPENPQKREIVLSNAALLLEMTVESITNAIKEQALDKYTPVILKYDIDPKTMIRFFERFDLYREGFSCENRPRRIYPLREKAGQVVGYTGIINKEELKKLGTNAEYHSGSVVGKMGIEKYYDEMIRGKEGILERLVDVKGNVLSEVMPPGHEPVGGNTIVLSLDSDLQELAYDLMGDKNGAVVVSKPATGEILALVSKPSFDPNIFTDRFSIEEFFTLKNNADKPFLNRAIQGAYPPSSIFKLVTASAILDANENPQETVYCSGQMRIGNRIFKCWSRHDTVNLMTGLANSCDVYFYTFGLKVGRDAIMKFSDMYGINRKTEIDIPGESVGLLPELNWFKKNYNRPWQNGDTANIAIGQGDLLATPIEINTLTATIVNNGVAFRPYILKKVISYSDHSVVWEKKSEVLRKVNLSYENFEFLRKAMRGVASYGTAKWLRDVTDVPIAAKTGTGEAGEGRADHAWFTCYAPYGATNSGDVIAVTVVVEHGGWGSAVAAPIAAQIIDYWFKKKNPMTFPKNVDQ